MNHFHIVWFIFTSIQIFSLIYHYDLSSIPAPILSGAYLDTPAILFNTSDLVTVLWLATLARIYKRKWSLKKRKIQAKLNAIAEDFSFKKFVYIEGSPALCQSFFPNKPHMQTFLTLQSKWTPEEELCLTSLFIHINNFKITITNLNSKFCIYYLKSWHFLNNWVSNFLEERSSTICASSPYNLGMKNWNQEVRSGVSYYTTFHKT